MADFLSSPRISKLLFHNPETIKYIEADRGRGKETVDKVKQKLYLLTADSSVGKTKPRERLVDTCFLKRGME